MVVVIQNDPLVPPGLFGRFLEELKLDWQCWQADQDTAVPPADAIIILGGTMGVNDEQAFPFLRRLKVNIQRWLDEDLPLLGICLGGQLLAEVAGGPFFSARNGEHGVVTIEQTAAGCEDPLFAGLPRHMPVFQWHNDSFLAPPHAELLASSAACHGQAFRLGNAWGLQFHPEVDRSIVELWGARRPESASHVQQYLDCADELAAWSRRLLVNFLTVSYPSSKQRERYGQISV